MSKGRKKRGVKGRSLTKPTNTRKTQPQTSPPTITCNYQDAHHLATIGPLMEAEWRVPPQRVALIDQAGLPVPLPIRGQMLVDTGASATCVSAKVVEELDLLPDGSRDTYGAHGKQEAFFYTLQLLLHFPDVSQSLTVGMIQQVMAVPGLDDYIAGIDHQGRPIRVIGLLGRDFLKHIRFCYDGDKGIVSYELIPHTFFHP